MVRMRQTLEGEAVRLKAEADRIPADADRVHTENERVRVWEQQASEAAASIEAQ